MILWFCCGSVQDGACSACWPFPIHHWFQVPYTSLLPENSVRMKNISIYIRHIINEEMGLHICPLSCGWDCCEVSFGFLVCSWGQRSLCQLPQRQQLPPPPPFSLLPLSISFPWQFNVVFPFIPENPCMLLGFLPFHTDLLPPLTIHTFHTIRACPSGIKDFDSLLYLWEFN